MKRFISIKLQFEATHCWAGCDIKEVEYLQHPHRHVFHITVKWPVSHADRQLEFIVQKHKVERFLLSKFQNRQLGGRSCEMLCDEIHAEFNDCSFVSVYEDGENGAEVYYE